MSYSSNLISELSFANYKSFKDEQDLELSSITLIFGYNNSGKSAILRALPFLSDSFKSSKGKTYSNSFLNYSSTSLRGAKFKDLSYSNGNKMSFSIKWESGEKFDFEVGQDGNDDELIRKLGLTSSLGTEIFRPCLDEDFNVFENLNDSKDKITLSGLNIDDPKQRFNELNELSRTFSNSVYWLNSTRVHPPREFEVGLGVPINILSDGSGTAESIWYLAETKSISFKYINQWLEETCGRVIDINSSYDTSTLGRRRVRLDSVSAPSNFDKQPKIKIPILDSGEGIAQALPVVTLCAQASNGELGESPILVIEQPELHLHPKATIALANFIVSCVNNNKNVRYVIETHSESFLIALQLALVNEQLKSDDFNCYWVQQTTKGASINKVIFDQQGFILDNWPDEVFREIAIQNRELLKARKSPK